MGVYSELVESGVSLGAPAGERWEDSPELTSDIYTTQLRKYSYALVHTNDTE